MSFRGSGPNGQAYNGQLPPPQPQATHPQLQRAPYLAHQQQRPHYPAVNSLPSVQPFNGTANLHNPSGHYVQPTYPPQHPAPSPTYTHIPPPVMPPPLQRPQHQVVVSANSPKPSPNRRISTGGAIQKPAKGHTQPSSDAVARSPSLSSKSPADSAALLVCIADECFSKAREAVEEVALSGNVDSTVEYHKLLATGLSCLEAAIQTNTLSPRTEAIIKLRYGSILCEETENIMEAETMLLSAITLCEKHRLVDLKLYIQLIFIKVLFQRNPRAALKAVDGHISDCTIYKQTYWIYAWRFLKASFHLQTGNVGDVHALENLRSIGKLATERGDNAIHVLASLLEGLAHLKSKTMKDEFDIVTRVQYAIADASKFQLDASARIPQLDILMLLLDLSCSLLQKEAGTAITKFNILQARLDELKDSPSWTDSSSEMLLPMWKQSTCSFTISSETAAVIRPGNGGHDFLVLSSFTKAEAYGLAYSLCGLASLYKSSSADASLEFLDKALDRLSPPQQIAKTTTAAHISLYDAIGQEKWKAELGCYIQVVKGLQWATRSHWAKVKECAEQLRSVVERLRPAQQSSLDIFTHYLFGIYYQGIGNLDAALQVFEDRRFGIDIIAKPQGVRRHSTFGVCLLATLNRLLIMQGERFRNTQKEEDLIELLRHYCPDYPDTDIKTAFAVVQSAIQTEPPLSMNTIKRFLQQALSGAQKTNNTHCLSIALNIMRCRLFENVVGAQAVKSAKAGSAQAKKSGNLLWMSVSDGMLAQSYEIQGERTEARSAYETATRHANESWQQTQFDQRLGDL